MNLHQTKKLCFLTPTFWYIRNISIKLLKVQPWIPLFSIFRAKTTISTRSCGMSNNRCKRMVTPSGKWGVQSGSKDLPGRRSRCRMRLLASVSCLTFRGRRIALTGYWVGGTWGPPTRWQERYNSSWDRWRTQGILSRAACTVYRARVVRCTSCLLYTSRCV